MFRPLSTVAPLLSLALPLAVFAPGAKAQVNVTATASNLHYTLADLRPGDAAAPEVRFGATTANQFLQGSLHAFHGTVDSVDDYNVNLTRGDAGATALENSWSGGGTILSTFSPGAMQGWRNSTSTFMPRLLNQSYYAFGRSRSPVQAFELAPHSSMTVYLDIAMDMDSGHDTLSSQYGYGMATLLGSLGAGTPELSDEWAVVVGQGQPIMDFSGSDGLSLSFSNDGDAWISGSFGWTVDSVANVYVPVPIPEPGAWAMYAAGVLLLAGAARRRRSLA